MQIKTQRQNQKRKQIEEHRVRNSRYRRVQKIQRLCRDIEERDIQRKESKNIENCDNVNRLEIEKNLKYLSLGGVV